MAKGKYVQWIRGHVIVGASVGIGNGQRANVGDGQHNSNGVERLDCNGNG